MNLEMELRRQSPRAVSSARVIAHKAVQFLTKAARANLPAAPDDSHSNLSWDNEQGQFLSQPLSGANGAFFVSLSLTPMTLGLLNGNRPVAELALENVRQADAAAWLDRQLEGSGLKTASAVTLPYDLPPEVAEIGIFHPGAAAETLAALSAWFSLAETVLSEFTADKTGLAPGPSPVRCWPHHFDIATYVSLETGDFETAKGIGVGMSPGDESYDQPYFYINPWPQLRPDDLPGLPAPGHWHKAGFVGAIATAEEALSLTNIHKELPRFIDGAFGIGREKLGV